MIPDPRAETIPGATIPGVTPEVVRSRPVTGWRWHRSRTGSWLRPISTMASTVGAAARIGRVSPGRGRVTVVVDPDDDVGFAASVGAACRRSGRFVVHTSPGQNGAVRMQREVLYALGKSWDYAAQGGDALVAQLVQVWLRAEQARDLVVLRAHHITGPALRWLVSLAGQEGLRVWLISPLPLPRIVDVVADLAANPARPATISGAGVGNHDDTHDDTVDAVIDVAVTSAAALGKGPAGGQSCACDGCEDLNLPAADDANNDANDGIEDVRAGGPCAVLDSVDASLDTSLSVATARRLRRLYDIEAAALAAAAVLQGRPDPEIFAAAAPQVAPDAATMVTAQGVVRAVPEHARALLRGWAGRPLVPREWALDVATAYLTLRLEVAARDSGIALLDPALPLLAPVAWHNRYDPGAAQLAWLTRSNAVYA